MTTSSSSSSTSSPSTLLDQLQYWAVHHPQKSALSFLDDQGEICRTGLGTLTYLDLAQRSSVLAIHLLQQQKLKAGDRVLLVYPPSLDFIVAFVACLKAGIIAVPAYPPDPRKLYKDLKMFATIVSSCDAKAALTSSIYSYATKLASLQTAFSSLTILSSADPASTNTQHKWPDQLQWIVTDSVLLAALDTYVVSEDQQRLLDAVQKDEDQQQPVAFLQYTSGSTSEPKGVVITRTNLTDNLVLITTGLKAGEDTVVVSWLPQYHDMGLIGSYLALLYCGGTGYYLSPLAFVRNPPLWVQTMSRYRATHVQAPNFAYALTARKFLAAQAAARGKRTGGADALPRLDLSSLRHMINAAEPVEAASVDLFHAVFEPFGLPRGVVYPTYGLAEHTVYVCSNGQQRLVVDKHALEVDRKVVPLDDRMRGEDSSGSEVDTLAGSSKSKPSPVVLMGCGRPCDTTGLVLHIVDTREEEDVGAAAGSSSSGSGGRSVALGEDCVGEIWLKSASCAKVSDYASPYITNNNDALIKYVVCLFVCLFAGVLGSARLVCTGLQRRTHPHRN